MKLCSTLLLAVFSIANFALAQSWPQGSGPNGDFVLNSNDSPIQWSVVRNQNIAWKTELPELGQSSIVTWGDKLFFTINQPVDDDAKLGTDIVAYCCSARDGSVLWTRKISGKYPLKIASSFGDSSGPPPVTDGRRVCFFNSGGAIEAFDLSGKHLWRREAIISNRSHPIISGTAIIYTQINSLPDEKGGYPNPKGTPPLSAWTQLQAIDIQTGKALWATKCGANMGSIPLLVELRDGRSALLVGRGGGHAPPEKPIGISLVDATDGSEIWNLPIENFNSTMTKPIHNGQALIFHDEAHSWIDLKTGTITRKVSIIKDVAIVKRSGESWNRSIGSIVPSKNPREITQQSNLLVGDYHYFRSYTQNYLGRVNVNTGIVEYLQLPVSMLRAEGQADRFIWDGNDSNEKQEKAFNVPTKPSFWTFKMNSMVNSRGFQVMGDIRSQGNGWGHVAAPIPTAVGKVLYIPVMNGLVYVIDWNAKRLDENALLSINDLGPLGDAWTRSSITYSNGKHFARTIRELICIQE